jgi:hypothetical protein
VAVLLSPGIPTSADTILAAFSAWVAVRMGGAARMADIAIRFWDLMARSRDQKLFPHFGEAGTAVFAVEEVEYGRHDRTPSFDHHHAIISLGFKT